MIGAGWPPSPKVLDSFEWRGFLVPLKSRHPICRANRSITESRRISRHVKEPAAAIQASVETNAIAIPTGIIRHGSGRDHLEGATLDGAVALAGRHALVAVHLPARPRDLDRVRLVGGAETERGTRLRLREVAGGR